jgi:hypothetical protein
MRQRLGRHILVLSPKVRTLPEWRENPVVKTVLGWRGASPDWCHRARGTTYIFALALRRQGGPMSKIIERCAGIDVGKSFLLCCVLIGAANEEPESETRRVDTTVPELEQLREWLQKFAHC